jgi:hypothetical protein
MLHDRILKARAVKQELDVLIARQMRLPSPASETVREPEPAAPWRALPSRFVRPRLARP